MLAHLYFQQQLLRERHESLVAAAGRRELRVARPARRDRVREAAHALGARVLGIPASRPLHQGC